MSQTGALIWFIVTTVMVFGMLTIGTYFAVRSYDEDRHGMHLWHRHG